MKKLLILTLSALLFAGCGMLNAKKTDDDKTKDTTETTETKETKTDDAKIKTGDTVVAKWSSGSFYEGKVESVGDTKIKVAWLDKSAPSDVDTSDVYALPKSGAKPDVKVGDMVLAKTSSTGTYWNGAEVTSIDGDVYKVKPTSITSSMNVGADKIIKVSAATAADFKDKAGATDFMTEAKKHRPDAPTDFTAKKGDKVLAEWSTNSWYTGKVDKVEGSQIYVAWDDGSKPSPLPSAKVLPMPTSADKTMPTENQYLLIKPDSGTKWQYAQATKIDGANIETKTIGDKTKTVKAGEFVLLN